MTIMMTPFRVTSEIGPLTDYFQDWSVFASVTLLLESTVLIHQNSMVNLVPARGWKRGGGLSVRRSGSRHSEIAMMSAVLNKEESTTAASTWRERRCHWWLRGYLLRSLLQALPGSSSSSMPVHGERPTNGCLTAKSVS